MSFAFRHLSSRGTFCLVVLKTHFSFAGQADDQERRVGVRRHPLGDPDAVHAAALRRADQRAGGRELQPVVPERRLPEVPAEAALVSQGDLRPDGRVLEEERLGQTQVRRDPPLPPEEEPGLPAGAHADHAALMRSG